MSLLTDDVIYLSTKKKKKIQENLQLLGTQIYKPQNLISVLQAYRVLSCLILLIAMKHDDHSHFIDRKLWSREVK